MAEALLILGMIAGIIVIPFGLPGAGIILLAVFIYAWVTGFGEVIGIPFFVVLTALTVIAETADNWLTMLGARRYGASSRAVWLSLLGGLAGAIFIGGPLALIFGPLGPLAGGFAGAFGVVFAYEYSVRRDAREALRAGWGTFLGRMAGIILKLVIAIAMMIAVAAAVWF